jgi:4-amino-4-deoxy-L-arabinose transferase-like glycosyltransferase
VKKTFKPYLTFYVLPALLVILIHLVSLFKYEPIQFDSNEYLSIATNIINNGQYSVSQINSKDFPQFLGESPTRMRQPLYPVFLALLFFFFGNSIIPVQLVQLILSLFTLFLIVDIGKRIFGSDYSQINNIILSIYFPLWMLSTSILTETVFIFFIIISFRFYIISKEKKELKFILLSGVLLGLAFLTRPIALILFLVIGSIHLYTLKKVSYKYFSILSIGFMLVIIPWTLRNYFVMDEFTPLSSDGGYNLFASTLGVNEKPWINDFGFNEAVQNGYYLDNQANNKFVNLAIKNFYSEPFTYITYGIKRIIKTWSYFPGSRMFENNSIVFYGFSIIQFSIIFLAICGWIKLRKKNNISLILVPIISFSIVLFFSYSISRFLIPVMPFVLLLAGQYLTDIKRIFRKMSQKTSINIF